MTRVRTFLLACGLVLFSVGLQGQDTVRIAGIEGNMNIGAGIAIVGEAYQRIGIKMEVHFLGQGASLEASNSGKLDGELQRIDGITRTWANLVQVEIPFNYFRAAAYSKNHNFLVNGWISLEPYSLGIIRGAVYAAQGTQGMEVTVADDYGSLLDMLDQDQIDIAVASDLIGRITLPQREGTEIKAMKGNLEISLLYHYVHRNNEHLVPQLEEELKAMLLDGTIRQISDRIDEELFAK